MLIPGWILDEIKADQELRPSEGRLHLANLVASTEHHAKKIVGGTVLRYRMVKLHNQVVKAYDFPTNRTARISIKVPAINRLFELVIGLAHPMSRTEAIVLYAIAAAHIAAGESIGASYYYLTSSWLQRMDEEIIALALKTLVDQDWKVPIERDVLDEAFQFVESLMTTSYEGRAPEIGVAVTRTRRHQDELKAIKLRDLLLSKKTRALFAGHRNLLICTRNGEVHQSYINLSPYSDVPLMPKGRPWYLAPYEYQPIMEFSRKRNAVTFLLTRKREVLVILGSQIHFIRSARAWRVLPMERFIGLLSELLWKNSKKRLSRDRSRTLAGYIGILCLSLRERGKGGLFGIYGNGRKPKESSIPASLTEEFFQSLLCKRPIVEVPVSMMCNAAAVDGATLLAWDGTLERFGVIVNTGKLKSPSEGARTRAAEFISRRGIAVKVSEDGEITLFAAGKPLMRVD
jgi:hypothetical protein